MWQFSLNPFEWVREFSIINIHMRSLTYSEAGAVILGHERIYI